MKSSARIVVAGWQANMAKNSKMRFIVVQFIRVDRALLRSGWHRETG